MPVLDDSCGQPLADQPQDPLIRDPVPEELLQPAPVELPEEVADIRVQNPVHLLPVDPGHQGIQRLVGPAARPEPVGEPQEVRLVDSVQHLDDGPLDDLVLQRGDAERPLPPVRLRDVHPARRARPVGTAVDTAEQVFEILPEILPVSVPRHPVNPWCSLRVDRHIGRPQASQVDVMQQCGEPRFLIPYSHLPHTVQPT